MKPINIYHKNNKKEKRNKKIHNKHNLKCLHNNNKNLNNKMIQKSLKMMLMNKQLCKVKAKILKMD